jgi:hypothetical protein
LREAIIAAGYSFISTEGERSFLAESRERVLWAIVFTDSDELLSCWQEAQVQAISRTEALSPEKAWELYLVLATELDPSPNLEGDLDEVRRDTSYARKVLVLGLESLSSKLLAQRLAPVRPLEFDLGAERPIALEMLRDRVEEEGDGDVTTVIGAFQANKPLFGDL